MKKLLLNVSFSKIYIMIMSLVCLLILGGYFSYAMFTVSKEKSNAISIVIGNLTYELLVDGEESNNLVVPAGSSKTFTITLNNPNNRPARFNFYYIGDLPINVSAGYIEEDGTNIPPSSMGTTLEKVDTSGSSNVYKITVVNNSDSEVTINLGVNVGLDYNDLSLEDNQHLFEKSKLVSDVLLDNIGSNGDYYDDGDDTFITGEDPNNYIWYSGKLWRAVSINDEARTVKLVTQWNISAINYSSGSTAFEGSYMEEWLNDTSVDGFLGNLRNPEDFIVMDYKWNATVMTDTSKPAETTMVENAVGLLNYYEYITSYIGASPSTGYLNNGLYWWALTPYSDSIIRNVNIDGVASDIGPSDADGVRPSINLKSDVKIVGGDGTEDNPYRLNGDNDTDLSGTLLSSRYSGEYVKFGNDENNLYRIVSHETEGLTKITSDNTLKNNDSFVTLAFGSDTTFSSTNTIGAFLNGEYLTSYVDNEYRVMIEDNTTWYLGTVGTNSTYSYKHAKYTDATGATLTSSTTAAKIGLLRTGELMSGQFDMGDNNTTYWTLTPYNSTSRVHNVYDDGYMNFYNPSYAFGVKPSFNLKSNVVITGGDGTKNNPFTLGYEDDGKIKVVNDSGEVVDFLKYSDGSYVNVSDTVKIVSGLGDTYVMDVENGSTANSANVQIYTRQDVDAQKFRISASPVNNYYNLAMFSNTAKVVEVAGSSTVDATNIQIYDLNHTSAQQWAFVESSVDGYYYLKSNIGTCIDVANGVAANNTNIQSFTCNQSAAQRWKFEKVS